MSAITLLQQVGQAGNICDPRIELCGAADTLLRPPIADLFKLWMVYIGDMFVVFIASIVLVALYSTFSPNTIDDSGFFIIAGAFVHVLYWALPVFMILVYMAVGSDFFLFRHFDEMSLYFITVSIPVWSFNIKAVTILAVSLAYFREQDPWAAGFVGIYGLFAGWLEYKAWSLGVNAALHIDPSWDGPRGKLYPPILYRLGIVHHTV